MKEIKNLIENPDFHPIHAVQAQLEVINEKIKVKEKRRQELDQIQTLLSLNKDIGADQLFRIMKLIQMERDCLTPERIEKLKAIQRNLTENQKSNLKKIVPIR